MANEQQKVTEIDLTPDFLKTPEGVARMNAAMDGVHAAQKRMADLGGEFVSLYERQRILGNASGIDAYYSDWIAEIVTAKKQWRDATEHFLQVMAGR